MASLQKIDSEQKKASPGAKDTETEVQKGKVRVCVSITYLTITLASLLCLCNESGLQHQNVVDSGLPCVPLLIDGPADPEFCDSAKEIQLRQGASVLSFTDALSDSFGQGYNMVFVRMGGGCPEGYSKYVEFPSAKCVDFYTEDGETSIAPVGYVAKLYDTYYIGAVDPLGAQLGSLSTSAVGQPTSASDLCPRFAEMGIDVKIVVIDPQKFTDAIEIIKISEKLLICGYKLMIRNP